MAFPFTIHCGAQTLKPCVLKSFKLGACFKFCCLICKLDSTPHSNTAALRVIITPLRRWAARTAALTRTMLVTRTGSAHQW